MHVIFSLHTVKVLWLSLFKMLIQPVLAFSDLTSGTQLVRRSWVVCVMVIISRPIVPSLCLMSRPESHTKMSQIGTEILFVCVKIFPLCCVGIKWTLRIAKSKQRASSSTERRTCRLVTGVVLIFNSSGNLLGNLATS